MCTLAFDSLHRPPRVNHDEEGDAQPVVRHERLGELAYSLEESSEHSRKWPRMALSYLQMEPSCHVSLISYRSRGESVIAPVLPPVCHPCSHPYL